MTDDTSSWITHDERISHRAFAATLALVMFALRWPALPAEWLQGILWTGIGLIIMLAPPRVGVPLAWPLLALGFVLCSSLGFLPRSYFTIPSWRADLESLGLDTGPHAFVQARLAAGFLLTQAITAVVVVYLLGHRIGPRHHHALAITFTIGVAILAAWAMAIHEKPGTFGFFTNRNHTACLLAIGGVMGFGSFIQAVRQKAPWNIGLSAVATAVILTALLVYSESRAGIVLLGVGLAILLPLMGRKYISGNAGIAMVIVLGTAIAAFFIVDSKAKARLVDTVGKLEKKESAEEAEDSPFVTATPLPEQPVQLDGRVSIFEDTLTMIRAEPWTGVGPRQFQYVFPQYRVKSGEPNDGTAFHPESNWLWLASESGFAATLCVFLALGLVMSRALRDAWQGRGRALRMGGIAAALLLPIHGLVDISGHHAGIAWGAALLLAMAFRPAGHGNGSNAGESSPAARYVWRGLGVAILVIGLWLLQAGFAGNPVLALDQVAELTRQANVLYDADQKAYDKAKTTNEKYDPSPENDPLEKALLRVAEASAVLPLDPYLHHLRGNIALHYDDKTSIVDHAFAIERRLAPGVVAVTLRQAEACSASDLPRTRALWTESLRRARSLEHNVSNPCWSGDFTYGMILQTASKSPELAMAALDVADSDPALQLAWAGRLPPKILDATIPKVLINPEFPGDKSKLFNIWQKRGTKSTVEDFIRTHPGFATP